MIFRVSSPLGTHTRGTTIATRGKTTVPWYKEPLPSVGVAFVHALPESQRRAIRGVILRRIGVQFALQQQDLRLDEGYSGRGLVEANPGKPEFFAQTGTVSD